MQRIFLTGLSGAGKSTVGELLAERLGWRLLDSDTLIEEEAGRTVVQLFSEEGEEAFRHRESAALRLAATQEQAVIATGGGAVIRTANRDLMRQHGLVVYLETSVNTAWQRLNGSLKEGKPEQSRPLLAGGNSREKLAALFEARQRFYEEANLRISTDAATPDEVARRVLAGACVHGTLRSSALPSEEMCFEFGTASVQTSVTWGGLHMLAQALQELGLDRRVFLVTDSEVGALYAQPLLVVLNKAGGEAHLCTIPAGEASKSLACYAQVLDWLVEHKAERHDALVALGGGVVGDLAGFVAATYQRGMPLVQVPTTLLAQVDAAIGGKTGINHPLGKNLIGAFYQPRLILADPACLLTLPQRVYREGWAEVIKYGMTLDADLFAILEGSHAAIRDREPTLLAQIVARCVRLKMQIVQGDEREQGQRAILNYGHTIGHALEAVSGYTTWLHGEAVAVGMEVAARLAVALGLLAPGAAARQHALLGKFGLPTVCPGVSPDALLEAASRDKKVQRGSLRWVLPTAIGQAVVSQEVPSALVQQALGEVCLCNTSG